MTSGMHRIHDPYTFERDIIFMMIMMLIAIILAFYFGSTIPAFENFRIGFFLIVIIAIWMVGLYIGRFGNRWGR
jgi:hypothetical protein